ncbi:MAG TPA: AzlD domain-containing protein [Solirubrobacteraceae bacterium]|nr:AzlD domain-containing protein [Solirubrobacteraceae bacterium]
MSTAWIAILLLAVGTIAIKAVGPVTLGGDALPPRLEGVLARLAPSLLAALVVVDTFGTTDRTLTIDETAAGLAAAAVALALRLPMIAVIVIAAVVTATLRAL